LTQES